MRAFAIRVGYFVCLLIGLSGFTSAADFESGEILLEESRRGDLATKPSSGGAWRVVAPGESLSQGEVRTSSAGPCRLKVPGATLHLAADTRVRLSVKPNPQVITLEQGRIYLQSAEPWEVTAGGWQISIPAKAAVEVDLLSKGSPALRVIAGSVSIREATVPLAATVTQNNCLVAQGDPRKILAAELSAAELARIQKWTKIVPRVQGLGELVVNDAQSQSPVRLDVARYHVNVVLHPPVALVQIDQSFYNAFNQQQEGTFNFQLPRGASVSRFAMYTSPSLLVEGELVEKNRAAQIYQSIVNAKRDPALLEQLDSNNFRMRVFPIFAHDYKRILLDYTLPLNEQSDGWYNFPLPLMGGTQPVWDFQVTGTIRGDNVAESAHAVSEPGLTFSKKAPHALRFEMRRQKYRPDGTLLVRFQQKRSQDVTLRSHTVVPTTPAGTSATSAEKKEPTHYFQATIRPEALPLHPEPSSKTDTTNGTATPLPADLLIVADTSGDFRQRHRQRRAIQTLVRNLRDGDRLQIGCIDLDFRPLTSGWFSPHSPEVRNALADLDRQVLLGKTDYARSLGHAAESLKPKSGAHPADRRLLLVYVGDGVVPELHDPLLPIAQTLTREFEQQKIRFNAVLLDDDPAGASLMKRLAYFSGGRIFDFARRSRVQEMFEWVLAGCPDVAQRVTVEAEGVPAKDLFVSEDWTPGRGLQVFGRRARAGTFPLKVSFDYEGKRVSRTLPLTVAAQGEDVFVGRLWGQHKLDQVQAQMASHPVAQERAGFLPQITAISQEWTLLSRNTSFLVLETDEEYSRYNIERSLRQKYWKPQDSTPLEGLTEGGPPLADRPSPRGESERVTREEFQQNLQLAREAIKHNLPHLALNRLHQVIKSELAASSAEFHELERKALAQVERYDLARALELQRGLFDRTQRYAFESLSNDPLQLRIDGTAKISVGNEDPVTAQLQKVVSPPAKEMSLENFATWLRNTTKLNVLVDVTSLLEDGLGDSPTISFHGIRSMSLRSLLRHGLGSQLRYWSEGNILKIGSLRRANLQIVDRSYPVADLITTSRRPDPQLLASPLLDLRLSAARRLEEKLGQRISVDFKAVPLEKVFAHLRDQLRDNFRINESKLAEEAINLQRPVTLQLKDVSIREILRQLGERNLATTIDDEAIIVTSRSDADSLDEFRLHSMYGLVFEPDTSIRAVKRLNSADWWMDPRNESRSTPWNRLYGSFGGAFGGMGGMGFGGGMGGGGAPVVGGGATSGATNSSSGSVAQSLPDEEITWDADDDDRPARASRPTNVPRQTTTSRPRSDWGSTGSSTPGARADFTQLMDLIQATIQPDTWQDNSGEGTIREFETTLSIIQRNTSRPGGAVGGAIGGGGFGGGGTGTEYTELADLIQATISPNVWQDNGGTSTLRELEIALAYGVKTTPEIQKQIEELLERMRKLPPSRGPKSGYVLARIPEVSIENPEEFDATQLIDFIQATVNPDEWQDNGGNGTVRFLESRLSLNILNTPAIHERVAEALTLLRRAMHRTRQGKVWKQSDLVGSWQLDRTTGLTHLKSGIRLSELPEPQPEELRILAGRREPLYGEQVWRSIPTSGSSLQVTLRSHAERRELAFDDRLYRIDGDDAVAAYPGLALAERGRWAGTLREIADNRLPWLPHRSNAELARMFQVVLMKDDAASFQLRYTFPATPASTFLLVTYLKQTGLPTAWESWMQDELTMRLKFEDIAYYNEQPLWRKITAEDAAGKVLERWQLQSANGRGRPISGLDDWPGYVLSNIEESDGSRNTESASFSKLHAALHLRDWAAVNSLLEAALKRHPDQPLYLYLQAWSLAQQDKIPVEQLLEPYRRVAAAGHEGLLTMLTSSDFDRIPPNTRYEALLQYPDHRSSPKVLGLLANAALAAGQPKGALEHLQAAARASESGKEELPFSQEKQLISLLLENGQADAGVIRAQARASRTGIAVEGLVELARILHQHGRTTEAGKLLAPQLADKTIVGERRYHLLLGRADLETGITRWRTILEAVRQAPEKSLLRFQGARRILAELIQPAQVELAGTLAAEAPDPLLKSMFLLRQADLYHEHRNETAAAEIGWKVYQSGQLPPDGIDWLCAQLNAARQYARVIELLEYRLRNRKGATPNQLGILAIAYDSSSRAGDAARVRTNVDDRRRNATAVSNVSTETPEEQSVPTPGMIQGGGLGMF